MAFGGMTLGFAGELVPDPGEFAGLCVCPTAMRQQKTTKIVISDFIGRIIQSACKTPKTLSQRSGKSATNAIGCPHAIRLGAKRDVKCEEVGVA